jgi:hypothetical protein
LLEPYESSACEDLRDLACFRVNPQYGLISCVCW